MLLQIFKHNCCQAVTLSDNCTMKTKEKKAVRVEGDELINKPGELKTDGPLAEKDEMKKAEKNTQKEVKKHS